jgi:hypothetical protein
LHADQTAPDDPVDLFAEAGSRFALAVEGSVVDERSD